MNSLVTLPLAGTAVAIPAALASPPDDSELLELEKQNFEQYKAVEFLNDEIWRLAEIWQDEAVRLEREVRLGRSTMSSKEQCTLVKEMPETKEHDQLIDLQEPFQQRMWL